SVRAPDENLTLIHAEGNAAKPAAPSQTNQPAPSSPPAVPPLVAKAQRPDNGLATAQAQLVKNTMGPSPIRPLMRPALHEDAGEGDLEPVAPAPGRNWTIQIGAYADKALALAQLKTYA